MYLHIANAIVHLLFLSFMEARLMETINAISRDHTVIMIAHRVTTLKDCDRIVVMENGVIKQITSYENLQIIKMGNYA